jgi:hypothetical protein
MELKLVFIVGPPRSGTTLLQGILASHSEVSTLPETHFFEELVPLFGKNECNPNIIVDDNSSRIIRNAIRISGYELENKYMQDLCGVSLREAFNSILKIFIKSNSKIVLEKTPGHARFIPEIRRFFPEAKIIGIIRHPVESVASMRNLRPVNFRDERVKYISTLKILANYWALNCRGIIDNLDQNTMLVRYEDLIDTPKEMIYKLCSFIGINFEADMLTGFSKGADRFLKIAYEPWKREILEGHFVDNRYKWRNKLSPGRIWIIEDTVKEYFEICGYSRSTYPNNLEKAIALFEERCYEKMLQKNLENRLRKTLDFLSRLLAMEKKGVPF